MQYLKNALLLATFALFSFGIEAAAPLHTSFNQETVADTPPGDGIVHIGQGRHLIRVEILVPGWIQLAVRDEGGEIVFTRRVRPQRRRVNIPKSFFAVGIYTLEAISDVGTEEVSFTIE